MIDLKLNTFQSIYKYLLKYKCGWLTGRYHLASETSEPKDSQVNLLLPKATKN